MLSLTSTSCMAIAVLLAWGGYPFCIKISTGFRTKAKINEGLRTNSELAAQTNVVTNTEKDSMLKATKEKSDTIGDLEEAVLLETEMLPFVDFFNGWLSQEELSTDDRTEVANNAEVVAQTGAEMRSDDMTSISTSYDRPELACVDCPAFVELTAKEKEDLLWQHVESDDYAKDKEDPGRRPWVRKINEGEAYKCYGMKKVQLMGNWSTGWFSQYQNDSSWLPVSEADVLQTCPEKDGFYTQCLCSDDFPMGSAWVPPVKRLALEAKRAWNGTMPMFFDRFSDVNPADNVKLIHSYGAVAKVKVVTTTAGKNAGYTGMFADGFDHGLFRLSIVTDFSKASTCGTSCTGLESFKPSLAIKFLRDGEISSNAVAQVNLGLGVGREPDEINGVPGWENSLNFFKFTHATWLPAPTIAVAGLGAPVVGTLFSYAEEEKEIAGVGIKELASAGGSSSGNRTSLKAPRLIYFVPTNDILSFPFSDGDHDPRHDFLKIPEGTHLYKIVALAEGDHCLQTPDTPYYWELLPKDCVGADLGTVVTKSPFVASDWGDRRLFFQHQRLKTKNGPWARKMCQTKNGEPLPNNNEFRMASDLSKTCSQKCGSQMAEVASTSENGELGGFCPYAYMENE